MFATDFLFDNQRASDFGCMICSFDGGAETASGGEIEYNVVKAPNRDKYTFYGVKEISVIKWKFSICKNPCKNDNLRFNQYEESMIAKWLMKTDGYKTFQFDQEGYEDIFYKVIIYIVPHQIFGETVGFDLEVTSNCNYGFTDTIIKKANISHSTPLILNIHSDLNTYIFPYVKIINGMGDFYIKNNSDRLQKATELENVVNEIVIDSDTDMVYGIQKPNDFNWNFLRLVDGINTIITNSDSDIEIEIRYREPRRVII